ncbi:complement factor H-related protein 2-like [Carettochelys insculpta]|uniref:complement factor H-related protein 2-like n=1 Tax=Carettochelys insculpta TaxID=44489 RepID=UPI003EBB8CEA
MAKRNIHLKWTSETKIYMQSGDLVELECNNGYVRDPTSSAFRVECVQGKLEYPKCKRRELCITAPEEMEKNNIGLRWTSKTRMQLESGEFVEFECKNGYVRNPTSSAFRVQCVEGKLEYPNCKRVELCVTSPEEMEKNNIGLKWTSKTIMQLESSEFVEFECKNGYVRNPTSSAFRVQCVEGHLEYPNCKRPEAAGKCGRPPVIDGGDILVFPKEEYVSGSRLEYKCQHFHRMQGSAIVICESGQWTDPPVCLEPCITSPEEMAKRNIHLKWTSKTKIYVQGGDLVELECNNGYVRDPTSSAFRVECVQGKLEYPKCKKRGK